MGQTMNACCSEQANISFNTGEAIYNTNEESYQQELQYFMLHNPLVKEIFSKRPRYSHHIDRNLITKTPEGTYIGKVSQGQQIVEGLMLFTQGFLYQGQWKNGQREGCGRMISNNGDVYEGKWVQNDPEGQGIYEGYSPKRKYIGKWQKGVMSGKGKAYYEDSSFYEGYFHQNMKHGKGKIKYSDGAQYQGQFKNNSIHGNGTLTSFNHVYSGDWVLGKMNGVGKSEWFNDNGELVESYQGQYHNGLKHGNGQYRWKNGRIYRGEWQNGEIKRKQQQKLDEKKR